VAIDGYYYLHTNGDLIWKKFEPEADSPFVKKVWPMDPSDRANAWTILLEALALGASIDRARDLATHWNCDEKDLTEMMARVQPTDLMVKGMKRFLKDIIGVNHIRWFTWLTSTPKGQFPDVSTSPSQKKR